MKHYKRLSDLHRENGFPPPENPLFSLYQCNKTCSIGDREFTSDFYMIGFKKLKSGVIMYGRTKYDHDCGSMMFVKPRQVIEMKNLEFDEDGFLLFIHEDFLNGHELYNEIKKYHFFDYETNEALHLSPREEQIIWSFYRALEAEYNNNQDEFSREIMLSNVSSMLKYAQRFYKRQFLNRSQLSGKTVTKFNDTLTKYFSGDNLQTLGLPTVNYMAGQMNVSPRYLSDLLKQESGKTALELIHIYLISEAKNMLIGPEQSVTEVAYTLGFENMSYFSRLFKKEVGVTPNGFKKHQLN
jgi:AraC family transcriptional activator of pobA